MFVKLFGEQLEVTPELCEKHALDFDFYFAVNYLCNKEDCYRFLYIYSTAFAKYDNITDDAWKKYYTKKQYTWDEYTWDEYTWDEYITVKENALVDYMKLKAKVFAEIYNSEV